MSKDMDIKEAYRVMQAECGIEVGDRVKVVRQHKADEMGYRGCSHSCNEVGCYGVVTKVQGVDGVRLDGDVAYLSWFPFFVLELVEKAKKPEKMVTINGKQVSESTVALALAEYLK